MKLLKRIVPEIFKSPLRSWLHSQTVTRSQAGQDIWVFGEVFNEMRNGFFLDIGAYDGVELSNTYVLEKRYAWGGICVEANPESFARLRRNRRTTCINACLAAGEGLAAFSPTGMFGGIVAADAAPTPRRSEGPLLTLATTSLGRLLADVAAPPEIDYLSIDIEGAEESVLGTFPFNKYRFKCMTIERPGKHLRAILHVNEYMLVKEMPGLDCFYVHNSFVDEYRANAFSYYRKKHLAVWMG